jgi:1,2-diacylglycerol 3-beta-glucosyltransferase
MSINTQALPKITVWVAARNETDNILTCLQHLAAQNYPSSSMQVLIGNDQSTDDTAQKVLEYIKDKPHFELVNINKTINQQRGKANVLANLYEHSTGAYFLITDADMSLPPSWAASMVNYFMKKPTLGHLVGISGVRSRRWYGYLQSVDWLWALTLLKLASVFNIPLTGLGNNSAISRKAYEATGGYAKIPFSITEDFALFHEVVRQGFDFHNAYSAAVFAQTTAMDNIKSFLHQRKRWMVGALQCPWWVVLFLYTQALFPVIFLLICIGVSVKAALLLAIAKWLAQCALVVPILWRLKQKHLLLWLIPYELYTWCWSFTMLLFYYWPSKIDWKGRYYDTN